MPQVGWVVGAKTDHPGAAAVAQDVVDLQKALCRMGISLQLPCIYSKISAYSIHYSEAGHWKSSERFAVMSKSCTDI